jgi:hypothetical protein
MGARVGREGAGLGVVRRALREHLVLALIRPGYQVDTEGPLDPICIFIFYGLI